jgi:hypothetical protein
MKLTEEELFLLKKLEESLWSKEVRFSKEKMNILLDDEFLEIGASGKIYNKRETLNVPLKEINAKLPLAEFSVKLLSETIVLINYRSIQYTEGRIKKEALRSSIWIKKNNTWKIVFHQGTLVQKHNYNN